MYANDFLRPMNGYVCTSPARRKSRGRVRSGEWDTKLVEGVYATCAALHKHGGGGALRKIKACIPTYDP